MTETDKANRHNFECPWKPCPMCEPKAYVEKGCTGYEEFLVEQIDLQADRLLGFIAELQIERKKKGKDDRDQTGSDDN